MERLPILKICRTHGVLTGCRAALSGEKITDNHCTDCELNDTEACVYHQGVEARSRLFQAKEVVCVGRCAIGKAAIGQELKKGKVWDAHCGYQAVFRTSVR